MIEVRVFNEESSYKRSKSEPMLYYKGRPMFKFGPMSETSTLALKLGSRIHDVTYWAKWQKENGMGYVRCYPEQGYGWVDTEAEGRLYPFEQVRPLVFDLDRFSDEYWQNFRNVAKCLCDNDVIMHLQLVQVCYFKNWVPEARRWQCNYWNHENNVNDYTKNLEPTFPFSDKNNGIMNHWKRYIMAIMDAVGDLGNVIIDLGNELSSEKDWIEWNIEIMKEWEKKHGVHVIKGIDFTHMDRPSQALVNPDIDVIMIHGEHVDDAPLLRKIFKKPVVSVISRDTEYLGLAEGDQPNEDRFRRLHYRCLMNKVQGMGDYGKMMGGQDKKRTGDVKVNLNVLDPERIAKFASDAKILNEFYNQLIDYSSLSVTRDRVINWTKGARCYCLNSNSEIVIYLEPGFNALLDGTEFDEDTLVISVYAREEKKLFAGVEKAEIIDPSSGMRRMVPVVIEEYLKYSNKANLSAQKIPEKVAKIKLPAFKNDLLVIFKSANDTGDKGHLGSNEPSNNN